ncbi:MAG TPA: FAD-dependent oxidoreductase [Candidatus Paceibacterota bacterium]|nr:FAD-dependent oxidoreductase [Candidatus Paceibacterota bacterium]
MHDLIIIGGGPGGVAAGVYASRKKLATVFITKEWGGQSTVSTDIQNWIGTKNISGSDLAKNLEGHLRAYADDVLTVVSGRTAVKVEKLADAHFKVTLDNGDSYEAKTLLITTGSTRRKLEVPGAEAYDQKGLTYCASCDGPLFAGQDVAVIGGGNAGFESAAQLLAYAKSVTLLHRSENFRADPVTVEKVLAHPNMKAVKNVKIKEVVGDRFVTGVVYDDAEGTTQTLPVAGIFVEIGLVPTTECVAGLVELDEVGRIKIDPWTGATSTSGVWAAGDCTNIKYHQNNISAGNAVTALEDIYVHLKTK